MQNTFPKKGLLIIGGGQIQKDSNGKYHIAKQSVSDYLIELATIFDHVDYFSSLQRSRLSGLGPIADSRIRVHLLRYTVHVPLFTRIKAYIDDLKNMVACARLSEGVISVHPAAGGLFSDLAIRLANKNHIVYFGSDPLEFWSDRDAYGRIKLSLMLRRWYFLLSAWVEVRVAAHVLVRNSKQLERLSRYLPGKVTHSMPVSSLTNRIFERSDTCRQKDINLLYVGVFRWGKGITDLLEAFSVAESELLYEGKRLCLKMVGTFVDDPGEISKEQIESLSQRLGIGSKLYLAGYINDIDTLAEYYRKADIFILPSLREGFPRVVDEAMSFSLPIIATNIEAIAAVLIHEVNALLVPPQSPLELSKSIIRIVKDEEIRKRIIAGAHQLAKNRFSETAAKQHARIILS